MKITNQIRVMEMLHDLRIFATIFLASNTIDLVSNLLPKLLKIRYQKLHCTKMKFSLKDFFSKCDELRRKLRIWSQLLKKSLMENFIFCAVLRIIISRKLRECHGQSISGLSKLSSKLNYVINNIFIKIVFIIRRRVYVIPFMNTIIEESFSKYFHSRSVR